MVEKSRLENDLESKDFVITAELTPPKGTSIGHVIESAQELAGFVSAFNITDNQRAVMRMSPLVLCGILKSHGFDPIYQITCRDRNLLAIQSDLLGAAALGIKNVLALTGDFTAQGDHPFARPVYDMDSVQLVHVMKKEMEKGQDMAGKKLKGSPRYFTGVVVNQDVTPRELQLIKAQKKIDQGAQFIQTQAVFDIDNFYDFIKQLDKNIPVIAGIFPLKSARMARFLRDNVPGVYIPEEIITRMESAEDQAQEGINIAAELVDSLQDKCSGVHFMTMGSNGVIKEILACSGVDKL